VNIEPEQPTEKFDITDSNETPTSSPSLNNTPVHRVITDSEGESNEDTIDRKRRLMLEAAQRRQGSKKDQ
jgi:hypothetical protein